MNKITLWMYVCVDDWTAEWVIIASNVVASNREPDFATVMHSREVNGCHDIQSLHWEVLNSVAL